MRSVLLPVDGSRHAFAAALYLIAFARSHGTLAVHVVNVQPAPVLWQTHGMESEAIESHLAVQAHMAMNPVLNALNEAGVAHRSYVKVGDTADTIVALAEEVGCDTIVMGTRGMGGLAALALGSVTRKVLHLAKVPVVCIKDTAD